MITDEERFAPHAEVEQVWPEDGHVRVLGYLHGVDDEAAQPGEWRIELTLRDPSGPVLGYPASVSGRSFEATVPIAGLVPEEAPAKGVWDLHLVRDALRLRVGRRLDDIRGKVSIMVYPAQTIASGPVPVQVRPRYTILENLSIDYWQAAP